MLEDMPNHEIIAWGVIENSMAPDGIYMTDGNIGKKLFWVAKRGRIHDWAIYCDWEDRYPVSVRRASVLAFGNKIHTKDFVKKLVPCDDAAFSMYRF